MASYFEEEDLYYKYEVLEKVWTENLWYNHRARHGRAKDYFRNFARNHPGFEMTIVRIYDGTRHPTVTTKQYRMMKRELEEKTGIKLPEIDRPTNVKDPTNVIVERRRYSNQDQMDAHFREIINERNEINAKARQDAAEHTRKLRQALTKNKEMKFLCFDLEVYDRDWNTMLEIGYVEFTLKEGDRPEYFHAVVNDKIRNRKGFDNKEKFKFGTTVRMPLKDAGEELKRAIAGSDALVTHSGHNDERYLAENGIVIENKPLFDTQVLGLNLLPTGPKKPTTWSLKRILEETHILHDESILHNAGNDAHYTMMAFKALVKRAMPSTRF
ncbi:uncharacterized protein YDR514C-like [Actinia tenebrosa]|uniref:Uncharacterized protein YDR514C-like n=1 Tax=Actinia tenebrosa TaxID=6105 RepID=A0A6P8IXZ7_ACTTE|nr:uncharacterized protein YDR514C-like [Actinia tenebrosa]